MENAFPVPLVCPTCKTGMSTEKQCTCRIASTLEYWNGIPRMLFGQKYWGECSSEKMSRILNRMGMHPWRQVIEEESPIVHKHLSSKIGPDFVYGMPWNEIESVLDIGSGMGFLTALLAQRAKYVVALEAVPERALFQKKRAAQDGQDNWFPVIASAMALPFADETFDLITLNGVFEYIGLWGQGDPQDVQQAFLSQVFRLLKPRGYLYIGVETRYALSAFRGSMDHSGMAFTSLMPRWLADWYCRLRRTNFFGSEHIASGYRTYTYTPTQYKSMVRQAGFAQVHMYGTYDGYNRQQAIYDLEVAGLRRHTLDFVRPRRSLKGRFASWLTGTTFPGRLLEDEVAIIGRKTEKEGNATWDNIPRSGPISQFSTDDKVFVLQFNQGMPSSLFKGAKNSHTADRLAHEYAVLTDIHGSFDREANTASVRGPRPLNKLDNHGIVMYQYEFIDGCTLATAIRRRRNWSSKLRFITSFIRDYVSLCKSLTDRMHKCSHAPSLYMHDAISFLPNINDAVLERNANAAFIKWRNHRWPSHLTHGDLSLGNCILQNNGGIVLIDWEHAHIQGNIVIDLIRLLYDITNEATHLSEYQRTSLLETAKASICGALQTIGIAIDDLKDLESLFVAEQCHMRVARGDTDLTSTLSVYKSNLFQ
jgi:SAM-dependent methyltransferase